jgi:hypothetical protein
VPFLRFTRDKRGYENTYVMHSARRHGRLRPRMLYWFRTPPNIRVGRAPLDEEAIRALEEGNPDIIFDWRKMLEARPAPSETSSPASEPRSRDRRDVRSGAGLKGERAMGTSTAPNAVIQSDDTAPVEARTPELSPPPAGAPSLSPGPLGDFESQVRLRARYAELLARIAERGGSPERQGQLRKAAEPLNPDSWTTQAEIEAGLASFEEKFAGLRRRLARRRRRSRRPGGRRLAGEAADTGRKQVSAGSPGPKTLTSDEE